MILRFWKDFVKFPASQCPGLGSFEPGGHPKALGEAPILVESEDRGWKPEEPLKDFAQVLSEELNKPQRLRGTRSSTSSGALEALRARTRARASGRTWTR